MLWIICIIVYMLLGLYWRPYNAFGIIGGLLVHVIWLPFVLVLFIFLWIGYKKGGSIL
ncbi:MAG TPA: hypothetical protein IAA29_00675 [Candidatus Paenibacillus intestinavium]|nr:hypothetical protein [Candidatus Paenibacillus intestinavium]